MQKVYGKTDQEQNKIICLLFGDNKGKKHKQRWKDRIKINEDCLANYENCFSYNYKLQRGVA